MRLFFLLGIFFSPVYSTAQPFVTGRTAGSLPFLNYGLGTDRLGGAKITYLDTSILVRVIDSTASDFKIKLSSRHEAWLPKQFFIQDSTVAIQPYYHSASWRVWGDDSYDYVTVSLTEKLPYKSMQLLNPSMVVVDIFGVTNNTNWITQLKTARAIKNVWHEQIEDDVFRVFIQLYHNQHWGHSIYYQQNQLTIRIRQQPRSLKLKDLKIVVDAGHGGSNTGAVGGTTGILEKDYTLKIARLLERELKKKGAEVIMLRSHDTDIIMVDRALIARSISPDLLISIHLNSSSNKSAKGTSTYYRHIGFRPLSQYILEQMLQLRLHNFGNIGSFNFTLNGPTDYPNCLVEVAFLSNAEDEQRILNEKFHRDVAVRIRKGIRDWLKSL